MDFATLDVISASPDFLRGLIAGAALTWAFATKTSVKAVRDQLEREREMFNDRLSAQEKRFQEQVALLQSHIESYARQLESCQSKLNGA